MRGATVAFEMLVAGFSTGVSAAILTFQVIQDGATPSTGVQTGILGGAVAVITYLERARRRDQDANNLERRQADDRLHRELDLKDAEIVRLNTRIEELLERIIRNMEDGRNGA